MIIYKGIGEITMTKKYSSDKGMQNLFEGFRRFSLNEVQYDTKYTSDGVGVKSAREDSIGASGKAALQHAGLSLSDSHTSPAGDGSSDIVTILQDGKISLYFKGQHIGTTHDGQEEAYWPTHALHKAGKSSMVNKKIAAGLAQKLRRYQDDMPIAMELADVLEQGWAGMMILAIDSF
jgi:hypothetical protein